MPLPDRYLFNYASQQREQEFQARQQLLPKVMIKNNRASSGETSVAIVDAENGNILPLRKRRGQVHLELPHADTHIAIAVSNSAKTSETTDKFIFARRGDYPGEPLVRLGEQESAYALNQKHNAQISDQERQLLHSLPDFSAGRTRVISNISQKENVGIPLEDFPLRVNGGDVIQILLYGGKNSGKNALDEAAAQEDVSPEIAFALALAKAFMPDSGGLPSEVASLEAAFEIRTTVKK